MDVQFERGQLPDINNAIQVKYRLGRSGNVSLSLERALHLGDNLVRTIAMASTDGLVRGMEAIDTGAPISVPVGREVLGRVFNVLGQPIDEAGEINAKEVYPIHREAAYV